MSSLCKKAIVKKKLDMTVLDLMRGYTDCFPESQTLMPSDQIQLVKRIGNALKAER